LGNAILQPGLRGRKLQNCTSGLCAHEITKKTLLNGLPHCDECSISVSRFTAKISDIRFQEKSAPPSFFLIIQQKQP
jgi:hypothetical protein